MVKFSDLKNGDANSRKPSSKKESDASRSNSRLSFRKLAAEQKKALHTDKVASEKEVLEKDPISESGEAFYKKAASYLKQVFEAVKRRKMFSLDPGLQIVREMVEVHSFQDALFIEALHFDDPFQFIIHNNINVAIYAIKMAQNLGLSKDRQIEIGMAGLMHDIGMALIPEKLIYKQQRLSEAEFKIFKERSNYSYKILKSLGDDYAYLAESAIQVNERLDGSGYPQGLKGDEIGEYAQIIGLVDMYEALIHSRPQREKFHHFTAVKEIIKSGKNLFQRSHLKALLNIFSIFPLHSYVRLNSNAVGRVIETYPDLPMRPRLKIVLDSQQKRVLTERIVNLPDDPLLYVVDSVDDEELQPAADGSDSKTRTQTNRVQEDDDLPAEKVATEVVEDELPDWIQEAGDEDYLEPVRKTGWLKPALIIGGIALLVVGLVIQYGNNDSELLDAGKFQPSVIKKEPGSAPPKEPVDISLPSLSKSRVHEDISQKKPDDSQAVDSKNLEIGSVAIADKALQTNSRQAETVIPETSFSDKEQESIPASTLTETEPLETSSKTGLNTESIKRLYPYSIKLHYFRSRKRAEESLAAYRQKGFSPYWVKADLGDQGVWYRVFTGYFEEIEQAENIIKTRKLTKAAVKKTRYATLIGTYRSETDANSKIELILKQGFSAYVVKGVNNEFYVYVGAFYTQKGAQSQYADLLAAGIKSKVVER